MWSDAGRWRVTARFVPVSVYVRFGASITDATVIADLNQAIRAADLNYQIQALDLNQFVLAPAVTPRVYPPPWWHGNPRGPDGDPEHPPHDSLINTDDVDAHIDKLVKASRTKRRKARRK